MTIQILKNYLEEILSISIAKIVTKSIGIISIENDALTRTPQGLKSCLAQCKKIGRPGHVNICVVVKEVSHYFRHLLWVYGLFVLTHMNLFGWAM